MEVCSSDGEEADKIICNKQETYINVFAQLVKLSLYYSTLAACRAIGLINRLVTGTGCVVHVRAHAYLYLLNVGIRSRRNFFARAGNKMQNGGGRIVDSEGGRQCAV